LLEAVDQQTPVRESGECVVESAVHEKLVHPAAFVGGHPGRPGEEHPHAHGHEREEEPNPARPAQQYVCGDEDGTGGGRQASSGPPSRPGGRRTGCDKDKHRDQTLRGGQHEDRTRDAKQRRRQGVSGHRTPQDGFS
jgi:hypothetical protein